MDEYYSITDRYIDTKFFLFFCRILVPLAGEGTGTPLQYSCLENPMDGGAWWAAVHGVTESQTRLSIFTFTFHFHTLEKEMASHSSVLAWRIPGMGEPRWLPSMGSHRVGHNSSDLAAAAAVPLAGIEPRDPAVRVPSPKTWTIREFPIFSLFIRLLVDTWVVFMSGLL